jgi:hypothetical protein
MGGPRRRWRHSGRQRPRTVSEPKSRKAAHLWVEWRLNQVHVPICRLARTPNLLVAFHSRSMWLPGAERAGSNFSRSLQDIDRPTSRDWDDNLDLRKALQMLISQMNEEAALQLELGSALSPVREGGPRRPGGMGAVPPGTWTVSGGRSWGKISESRPTMRRPALKLSSRCPKNGSAGDSHLPCPSRWGAGACTGPASKSELFGNRSVPQRRVSAARECSGDFLPPSPPA